MFSKPSSIVVGFDGSPHASRALQWAARQAMAEHRPLTIVHASHSVNQSLADGALADSQGAQSALDVAGHEVLDDARSQVEWIAPELEVHEILEVADPRGVLLRLSESAALVVVGSRGYGPLRSLLLGSVGVALTRAAHCPVVVIRPQNLGTVKNGVLVGADTSPESRVVLEFAYRQASLRDLPLTVLDCAWDINAGTMGACLVSEAPADLESERLALAESMAGMGEKYPDVHVTTKMARDIPQEALVGLGERMDLIVVGAHQDNRISQTLFGSVSVAVVEHAPCPVAVVPVSTTISTAA